MPFTDLPADLPTGLRLARPADYDTIAGVVDTWWGRPILDALPRLFLDHFHRTSLVAQAPDGALRGFLIGFGSPAASDQVYIHFVGIAPAERGSGLGRLLYETFLDAARSAGMREVHAVTAPVNTASIAFHRAMGFTASAPVRDYNGPGQDLVTFSRQLEPSASGPGRTTSRPPVGGRTGPTSGGCARPAPGHRLIT